MAPGYVIAVVCETAGLLGLSAAFAMMRIERRARSAELRGFLKSGQAPATAPDRIATQGRGAAPLFVDLPVVPLRARDAGTVESEARTALHRALARRDRRPADAAPSAQDRVEAAAA